jgi:hypothetical protein
MPSSNSAFETFLALYLLQEENQQQQRQLRVPGQSKRVELLQLYEAQLA